MTSFLPTRGDVYHVRNLLSSCGLPVELTLEILDHARYWVERRHETEKLLVLMDYDFDTAYSTAYLYVGISAFPRAPASHRIDGERAKIKEVKFLIVSHGML